MPGAGRVNNPRSDLAGSSAAGSFSKKPYRIICGWNGYRGLWAGEGCAGFDFSGSFVSFLLKKRKIGGDCLAKVILNKVMHILIPEEIPHIRSG